ncbi:MAG: CHAT domain-containing protein [Caldilineaceae bacterium]
MAATYESFELDFSRDSQTVTARFRGAVESESFDFSLPLLSRDEVRLGAALLGGSFINQSKSADLGSRLFETLIPGTLEQFFRDAYASVYPKRTLRIVLYMDAELARLPWEIIYDSKRLGFLARAKTTPVTRYFRGLPIPISLPANGPLRMLVISASPSDLPPVSYIQEGAEIQRLLERPGSTLDLLRLMGQRVRNQAETDGSLRTLQLLEVTVLTHATRASIAQCVARAAADEKHFHFIHYLGHGFTDGETGYVLLEEDVERMAAAAESAHGSVGKVATAGNDADVVAASDFANLIVGPETCLVWLNSCQTADNAGQFNSVAQAVLCRGVPSVVAMQTDVVGRHAFAFAQRCYESFALGMPLEESLSMARQVSSQSTPDAVAEWSVPVLYMGPDTSMTLDVVYPRMRLPWQLRGITKSATWLLSLLATLALLMSLPALQNQIRTQVPIIRCLAPVRMPETDFNIVIAPFTEAGSNGRYSASANGEMLARTLYANFITHFEQLNLEIPYEVRSPDVACAVAGDTEDARALAAARMATQINANVIIYGAVAPSATGRNQYLPEFYVDYRGFGDATELVGPYELGSGVRVELPITPEDFQGAEHPLMPRVQALSLIVNGLAAYANDDYDSALTYFKAAADTHNWIGRHGKEIVYLLMGNSYQRLATRTHDVAYLDLALAAHQEALRISPAFARAQVGLASTLYQKGLGDLQNLRVSNLDPLLFQQAEEGLALARTMESPPSAHIGEKSDFIQSQIDIAEYYLTKDPKLLSRAESTLKRITEEYSDGEVSMRELAGHAYGFLSIIAQLDGSPQDAVKDLEQAAEKVSPYWQANYRLQAADLYASMGMSDAAKRSYEDAAAAAEWVFDERLLSTIADHAQRLPTATGTSLPGQGLSQITPTP